MEYYLYIANVAKSTTTDFLNLFIHYPNYSGRLCSLVNNANKEKIEKQVQMKFEIGKLFPRKKKIPPATFLLWHFILPDPCLLTVVD